MVQYFAYCFHKHPPLTGPIVMPEDLPRSVSGCSMNGCQMQADRKKLESLKTF